MATSALTQLAASLKRIIAAGFAVDPATLRYINSTFCRPTQATLLAILEDETHCERDSLVELIFFPDESLQVTLEDQLEDTAFDPGDEDRLLALLLAEPLNTQVVLAPGQPAVDLKMPPLAVERLVERLRLGYRLDSGLRRIIDEKAPCGLRERIKVRLRNAGIRFSKPQAEMMALFFRALSPGCEDFLDCLELMLVIVPEIGPTTDVFQLLMQRKQACLQGLQRAAEFQRRLDRSNMEILMSQGIRPTCIDPADSRRKMRLIDTICRAVFGRRDDYAGILARPLDLSSGRSNEDIRKIFDLLS